jgi:hypothetical protein
MSGRQKAAEGRKRYETATAPFQVAIVVIRSNAKGSGRRE